jgi:hypothetical protein
VSKTKGNKKVKIARIKLRQTFVYTSVCCEAPAKKPPVERSLEDFVSNEYSKCGLGVWRCTKCAKKCKVKRSRVKESDGAGTESAGTNS